VSTLEAGRLGEKLAEEFLIKNGFKILDKNWRESHGELDIVALDNTTLVFIEVKYRSDETFTDIQHAITWQKAKFLKKYAQKYMLKTEVYYEEIRFDFIGVLPNSDGNYRIEHNPDYITWRN
jgi:putative endonuclease